MMTDMTEYFEHAETGLLAEVVGGAIIRRNIDARTARKDKVNFPTNPTTADYAAYNLFPIVGREPTCEAWQTVAGPTYQWDAMAQEVRKVYVVTDMPLDAYRDKRKEALEDLRWKKEVAGITVNGANIATNDRAKTLLNGKYRTAEKNPAATHRWKTDNGEVVLDSATIIAIGDAVGAHVQACFDRELDLIAALDAATTAQDVAAVDITTGWPAQP